MFCLKEVAKRQVWYNTKKKQLSSAILVSAFVLEHTSPPHRKSKFDVKYHFRGICQKIKNRLISRATDRRA